MDAFFLCQPSSALGMARAPPVLRLSLWLAALYGQLFISGHPEQAEHFPIVFGWKVARALQTH